MKRVSGPVTAIALAFALGCGGIAWSNALRENGKTVRVASSALTVTPPRDWNKLDSPLGKNVETWTLDGEQLNDVTFYGGVEAGKALVREPDKKHDPLPKFTSSTLLAEVPELLEGTYRTYKKIGAFTLNRSTPERFLSHDGVRFSYEYTDDDNLTRKGEARAAIIGGRLYMATFDAPRLYYFDRSVADFRALVAGSTLATS